MRGGGGCGALSAGKSARTSRRVINAFALDFLRRFLAADFLLAWNWICGISLGDVFSRDVLPRGAIVRGGGGTVESRFDESFIMRSRVAGWYRGILLFAGINCGGDMCEKFKVGIEILMLIDR